MILRVAPEPGQQFGSEWQLMRAEYASLPYLAVIAPLLPQVIAADWSQTVIGRDWMLQTCLDGVPAPARLADYPRSAWPGFFRQAGRDRPAGTQCAQSAFRAGRRACLQFRRVPPDFISPAWSDGAARA